MAPSRHKHVVAEIPCKVKVISGSGRQTKKKIVTAVILLNVVLIGVYLACTTSSSPLLIAADSISHRGKGEAGFNEVFHEENESRGRSYEPDFRSSTFRVRESRYEHETAKRPVNGYNDGADDDDDDVGDNDGGDDDAGDEGVGSSRRDGVLTTFPSASRRDGFTGSRRLGRVVDGDVTPVANRDQNTSSFRNDSDTDGESPRASRFWNPHTGKSFQPIDGNGGWVYSAFYHQPTVPLASPADSDVLDPSPSGGVDRVNDDDDGGKEEEGEEEEEEGEGEEGEGDTGRVHGPTIRVLVIRVRSVKPTTYCQFYDHLGEATVLKKGRRRSMKDSQWTRYGPFFIECSAPKKFPRPYYVSLTSDLDNDSLTNRVAIQYPGPPKHQFTVCFSPFHSHYNFTSQLVEAFEFNRILGADHFVVYNLSVSPEADAILRHYQTSGLVTVIPWDLPSVDIWYYGQILAVNDCIYRNRGVSKYVVATDTDEVIVPHQHVTWRSMISDIHRMPSLRETDLSEKVLKSIQRHTTNINPQSPFGGWSFRCAFYVNKRLEAEELRFIQKFSFTAEQKKFLVSFPSKRVLSLKRLDDVFDHGTRSKTIVRPECVEVGSIHVVPSFKPGFQMAYVKPQVAMLHHYRDFRTLKRYNTLDLSALRFKNRYLERLKEALMAFPSIFPDVADNAS